MKHPSIAIVGPGRLGSSLALHLQRARYRIDEVVYQSTAKSAARARSLAHKLDARASSLSAARLDSGIVWFCVPDSQIAKVAEEFSRKSWKGQLAFHSSGVLPSDILSSLRKSGAAVASVHPLMTFIAGSLPDLEEVTFAIEGDPSALSLASSIVRSLHAIPRRIRKQDRAAYHAFATMICPLLVSLLATAEEVAWLARVPAHEARKRMLPIVNQTLANYVRFGPAEAFTGPIVRGDTETVKMHLQALAKSPTAKKAYAALVNAALDFLPSRNRKELAQLLAERSPRTRR